MRHNEELAGKRTVDDVPHPVERIHPAESRAGFTFFPRMPDCMSNGAGTGNRHLHPRSFQLIAKCLAQTNKASFCRSIISMPG